MRSDGEDVSSFCEGAVLFIGGFCLLDGLELVYEEPHSLDLSVEDVVAVLVVLLARDDVRDVFLLDAEDHVLWGVAGAAGHVVVGAFLHGFIAVFVGGGVGWAVVFLPRVFSQFGCGCLFVLRAPLVYCFRLPFRCFPFLGGSLCGLVRCWGRELSRPLGVYFAWPARDASFTVFYSGYGGRPLFVCVFCLGVAWEVVPGVPSGVVSPFRAVVSAVFLLSRLIWLLPFGLVRFSFRLISCFQMYVV